MSEVQGPSKRYGAPHKAPGKQAKGRSRKHKAWSQALKYRSHERFRVNIGHTFQRWRVLKSAKGLKTDADVAQLLLDSLKTNPSTSASTGDSDQKIIFSQVELQEMIRKEVRSAVKKKETKLRRLIASVQHLENEVNYDDVLKKLEARIKKVSQRSKAALAYMTETQIKTPLPSLDNGNISRRDLEDETRSQIDRKHLDGDDYGKLCQVMETAKTTLHKLRADNRALTAAITDVNEEGPSPVCAPHQSPKCEEHVRSVKQEPGDQRGEGNHSEEAKQLEEPNAKRLKAEPLSPDGRNSPRRADRDTKKDGVSYAPLPGLAFPSTLNVEAAKYSLPQRVEVHLALIRNPASLSVLWNVTEEDLSAPPMDSYTIYLTMEKVKGSGVFPAWKMFGEVAATDLPMCVLIRKYKPGHKVCAAVVGKDVFGRYGPFSKVASAAIPD